MDSETAADQKALGPFERFVQAIFKIPKAAINEAEAKRIRRGSRKRET